MRQSRYGSPLPTFRSTNSVVVVEPSLGFSSAQPETDLQLGQTPETVNFLMRDGALEPRSRLSTVPANANPLGTSGTGGYEVRSSVGSAYPLISGTTRLAWYSQGSWSALSYVSAGGGSWPPSGTTEHYYDICQTYYDVKDDMVAVLACESQQTLFTWQSGVTIFSSITSAPRAKWVTTFDNFVLAANVRDVGSAQSKYVQRVQWSDRGGPFTWLAAVSNTAGFEDLLTAQGEITRLVDHDTRVLVFFPREIWQGVRGGSRPFDFAPFDRTIGTEFSWSIVKTPMGIVFLGPDFMLYLLPKEGGSAQPIGKHLQKRLRDTIDEPSRAEAHYDEGTGCYRLRYKVRGTAGITREVAVNLAEGSYALQQYAHSLTRSFPAYLQSAAAGLTYADLTTAGLTYGNIPYRYNQLGSSSTLVNRTVFLVSSSGTVYHFSSTATVDDTTTVEAKWRTGALGAEDPGSIKHVNQVRVDCAATLASSVTVQASRDQGVTFDPGQSVSVPAISTETQFTVWLNTPARYPMLQVTTEDIGVRIYRLSIPLTRGGQ